MNHRLQSITDQKHSQTSLILAQYLSIFMSLSEGYYFNHAILIRLLPFFNVIS